MPDQLDNRSCCTAVDGVLASRAFSAAFQGAPAFSVEMQSPIEFQWLGAHHPRRCRACGIA